jgi:hypothetical protein
MALSGKLTPATVWRAFFVLTALAVRLLAAPPAAPAPELAQLGKPDAAEARRILEQFRQAGLAGDHYLEFELHQLPRRGDEKVFHGRLWGGQNDHGVIERVSLTDGDGREHRFLLQKGTQPAVWRWADGRIVQSGVAALFEPLVPGVELTAFDLQMPFLFWPDAEVVSINRIHGRPAHAFVFRPPAEFAAQHAGLAAVRAYFDTQFNAPVQIEQLGSDGRVTKTFSLVDLQKVDGQMMPKSVDWRNETTREKTRFVVTGVALKLDFAPGLFEPAALAEEVAPPVAERIVHLAP